MTRRTSAQNMSMESPDNDLSRSDRHILATDLDDTLIPLPSNKRNLADLVVGDAC